MPGPGDRDDETGEPVDADDSSPDDTPEEPSTEPAADEAGEATDQGSPPGRQDQGADGPGPPPEGGGQGGHADDREGPPGRRGDPRRQGQSGGERRVPGGRDARQGQGTAGSPEQRRTQVGREPPAQDQEDDPTWLLVSRDVVVTVLAVVLIGGYLFAISGVWPPMVAIESGSMEPNMNVNDMVFVMDEDRFPPDAAHSSTGVVTAASGAERGYTQYGKPGDVIIFEPGGDEDETPIIHRAMFWVEAGENWYDRANESYVGSANSCAQLASCPAPHDGFITKGDANSRYDQASIGSSNEPVRPDWVIGTSEVRIPRLGWFRLQF